MCPWRVDLSLPKAPPPPFSPASGPLWTRRLRRSYSECHLATTSVDRREGDLVRKQSVYRAYVAMCRAEGWPTRLPAPALGKMVKRAFPFVGSRRLGPRRQVKHYYVGLCSRQLHHRPGAPADDADNATSDGGEWEHQCRCPVTTATSPCCLPVPPATSNPVHEQEPEEEPGQEECCCCLATDNGAENRCGEDNGVVLCCEASSCTVQSHSCMQRR